MRRTGKGPEFIRFFKPILLVLKQTGGSGTVSEVVDQAIEFLEIPEAEQEVVIKNGQSRVRNQVQWARLFLVRAGFIDSSERGVWSLTEKGVSTDPNTIDDVAIFRSVSRSYREQKRATKPEERPVDESDKTGVVTADYRAELLAAMKSLPASGFERLSQRLLRESGFQQVVVTGRSGDGGIDGFGILQLNRFMSFNVLFQCKRYHGAVTPSEIRDFRGAMMGRADKGIIITTGTFSIEARKEARRDGVPPIELVDGEALVRMFEQLELGLSPRKTFDIDHDFFDEFRR